MKYSALILIVFFALTACNEKPAATTNENATTPAATDTAMTAEQVEEVAPPDSATMMAAWMEYATPGEMHAMMKSWEGEWTGDMTMWHSPDAPASKATGRAVNKMLLDGRYLEGRHYGNMGGMPFEGYSLMGFDNKKQKFISTWIDNMGSGIMIMEGTYDPATKSMNFTGTQVDPVSGKDILVRENFKIVDDNTQMMEMFMKYPGSKEYKTMEMTLKRKAA